MMRRLTMAALALLAGGLGGCNWLAYPLYLISPAEPEVTQKAEFTGLKDRSVAVLVFAGNDTLFEYPYAREEVGYAVNQELGKNVKGCRPLDPVRVVGFQEANIYWDTMGRPEIARRLGVDYVLYVSLSEFTTREFGSSNLARGRIGAQVSLWQATPPAGSDGCAWHKDAVSVVFPPDQPAVLAGPEESQYLFATERLFADTLAKCFYDHKVPKAS